MFRVLVGVFVAIFLMGCEEQIVHNLSENEVNRLLTRLHERAIDAEKVRQSDGKWALSVPSSEVVIALKYLDDSRLLRDVEMVTPSQGSIVSSREDQRFKFERALSREIELTLSTLDGVLEARVHLNLPATDPLFGQPIDKKKGSASVLIVTKPSFQIPIAEISSLVSGASGIEREAVSVLTSINSEAADKKAEVQNQQNESPATVPVIDIPASKILKDKGFMLEIGLSLLIIGVGGIYLAFRQRRGVKKIFNSPPLKPAGV